MSLPSRGPIFAPSYRRLPYPAIPSVNRVRKSREGSPSSHVLVSIPDEVAVLDEHLLKDEEGNTIARLDPKKLEEIARNNNKRIDDTGDYCPIVVGHTKDDSPEDGVVVHEKDQPEVIGWAGPFRVKKFFKTGKKALFAKWRIYKDKVDLLRKFPRRSVELWVSRWEIDPISILGATTPDRDLGLVKLARPQGGKQSFTITRSNPKVDTSELVQQVVAALQQTQEWQFLSQLAQEAGQMGNEPEPEMPPQSGDLPPEEGPDQAMGGDTSMDAMGGDPGMTDEEYEGGDVPVEEEPIQKAAPVIGKPKPGMIYSETGGQKGDAAKVYCGRDGKPIQKAMGAPSGGNTFVPSYGPKKMSRPAQDSQRIKLARLERAAQDQAQELTTMRVKLARAEREKDLVQLEAEGYQFDREEELDYVAPLAEEDYGRHVTMIRKRYQRFGHGMAPGLTPRPAQNRIGGGSNQGDVKAQVKQAVELASRKNIPFDEAYKLAGGESVI